MNKMNREEAIALVGQDSVDSLDDVSCDFTNRVTNDGTTEFSASVAATDNDGENGRLVAYYYQDEELTMATEDLGSLDWTIDHYVFI